MGRASEPGEVVTLGEVMALFLASDRLPVERAAGFSLGYAGAEATVAVGLSRLGHRARLVSALGDDALGRRIRALLGDEGVITDDVRISAAPTGVLVRDAPRDSPVVVQYYRQGSAASLMTPDDVPADRVRAAALVHVTGITPALSETAFGTTLHLVELARSAGVPVSFDPNVRLRLAGPAEWRRIIEAFAPLTDIVLTGADDASVVTGEDPAAWFLERGATTVVVKDGARGARETDGRTTDHQPALAVDPVDPVGAGDAFAAGWLHAWLTGGDRARRLRTAATVAGLCVAAHGDVTGLPTAAELDRVLESDPDFGTGVLDGTGVQR